MRWLRSKIQARFHRCAREIADRRRPEAQRAHGTGAVTRMVTVLAEERQQVVAVLVTEGARIRAQEESKNALTRGRHGFPAGNNRWARA